MCSAPTAYSSHPLVAATLVSFFPPKFPLSPNRLSAGRTLNRRLRSPRAGACHRRIQYSPIFLPRRSLRPSVPTAPVLIAIYTPPGQPLVVHDCDFAPHLAVSGFFFLTLNYVFYPLLLTLFCPPSGCWPHPGSAVLFFNHPPVLKLGGFSWAFGVAVRSSCCSLFRHTSVNPPAFFFPKYAFPHSTCPGFFFSTTRSPSSRGLTFFVGSSLCFFFYGSLLPGPFSPPRKGPVPPRPKSFSFTPLGVPLIFLTRYYVSPPVFLFFKPWFPPRFCRPF